MVIAIIDDGVNCGYYTSVKQLEFDMCVNYMGGVVPYKRKNASENSHGTTCAAIIKKYSDAAKIGSIRILSNKTGRGKVEHLISAIKWCTCNEIAIINMSIGSTHVKDIDALFAAVSDFQKSGGVIISALANEKSWSIPACFNTVIGVKSDTDLLGNQYYCGATGIYDMEFIASSRHVLRTNNGRVITTMCCNSYAAPLITALVYNALLSNPKCTIAEVCINMGISFPLLEAERFEHTVLAGDDIDIPIVSVTGSRANALILAKELEKKFLKGGYPCACWTDSSAVKINLMPKANLKKWLSFFAKSLSLSIIILVLDDNTVGVSLADFEIIIDEKLKRNMYDGDTVRIPESFTSKNAINIFNYIKSR